MRLAGDADAPAVERVQCDREAVVDLTGLPGPERTGDLFWKETLAMASGALEIALGQLKLELKALNDPAQGAVVEFIGNMC